MKPMLISARNTLSILVKAALNDSENRSTTPEAAAHAQHDSNCSADYRGIFSNAATLRYFSFYLMKLRGILEEGNQISALSASSRFLLASRKCDTFSYTRNVTMQAGTTRVRLGLRPL